MRECHIVTLPEITSLEVDCFTSSNAPVSESIMKPRTVMSLGTRGGGDVYVYGFTVGDSKNNPTDYLGHATQN